MRKNRLFNRKKKSGFTLIELMSGIATFAFLLPASNQTRLKRSGFTLIELMIVIAIIAILASVLVPNFAKSREKAKLEGCKSNLRNLAVAAEIYRNDNNGTAPETGWITSSHNLVTSGCLKAVPTCPTQPAGTTSYYFGPSGSKPGDYYIVCNNSGALWHPGVPDDRPGIWLGHGFVPY